MITTTKQKISVLVVVMALMAVSFYGGTIYTKKTLSATGLPNGSLMTRGNRGPSMRTNGGLMGEIIAKDATSLTIKGRDGSSHFAFFGTSTPVFKSITGSNADLSVGTEVMIVGKPNADGSVNAQSVQVRTK